MSDTPAACEVEVSGNNKEEDGVNGVCEDTSTTAPSEAPAAISKDEGPIDVVMDDNVTSCVNEDDVNVVIADNTNTNNEDNGEASDETSSRRESNSSAEGAEDLEAQQNNHNDEADTTKLLSQLDNTNNNTSQPTHRKKKKKRRSKRKSRTQSRSVSRHNSAPDLTTPTTTTTTTVTTTTPTPTPGEPQETDSTVQHKTPLEEDTSYTEQPLPEYLLLHLQQDSSTSEIDSIPSSSSSSDTPHIPSHLLELTPPPTRGRSNAFYGSKAVPPLIHSNSDGAAIIAAQNTSAALSPKRNTMGSLTTPLPIPEPSHSGISKPKLFNYWRLTSCCQSFTGPVVEKSIVSHSKRFLVGFAETIGRRPSMEDYMVVHGAFRGRGHEDYFALFDGHGGKDAAAFAATHLHEVLAEKLKTNNAVKSLKEAFADTHKMISDQKIIGGTTAVVALFIGKKGFIANVGDTRAVLCRDGVPLRVSLDHKPELPTESSRIRKLGGTITTTYNSAGIATSRVNGMLAVSRALGDTPLHPYVSSDPEIHGPLNLDDEAKDQFVVLACDGVWDVLTDEEATSIVAPIANPEVASRRLRDEAFARGSTDNISVMVIRCPPFLPCD